MDKSAGRDLITAPRWAEVRWLARHFSIHALMDLSDQMAGWSAPHFEGQPCRDGVVKAPPLRVIV